MKKLSFFLLLAFLSIASCKQADLLPANERMAQILQQVVTDNNIKTAEVYLRASNSNYYNADNGISFKGGFLGVGGSYWNLDQLIYYTTYVNTSKQTILKVTF